MKEHPRFVVLVLLIAFATAKTIEATEEKCYAAMVCSNGVTSESSWKQVSPPVGCQSSQATDLEPLKKDFELMRKRIHALTSKLADYETKGNVLNQTIIRVENEARKNFLRIPREKYCYMGMKNYDIPNSAINASSEVDHTHDASFGRLDNSYLWTSPSRYNAGAWVAKTPSVGEWLQVDLGVPKLVAGVITQGRPLSPGDHDQWVRSFIVSYGNSTNALTTVKSSGVDYVFPANVDTDGKVVNMFFKPLQTRIIRLLPQTYHKQMAMRIELIKGECHGLYPQGQSTLP